MADRNDDQTATPPYFTAKAKAWLEQRGGDHSRAEQLAAWAWEAKLDGNPTWGVVVALDGTVVARTTHTSGGWAIDRADADRWGVKRRALDLGVEELTRAAGLGSLCHATQSELTTGAGRFVPDQVAHRATLIRLRDDRADVEQRLREAVLAAAGAGMPETQIAEAAGVARMTVRSWLGK